jgi:hypothetical protein
VGCFARYGRSIHIMHPIDVGTSVSQVWHRSAVLKEVKRTTYSRDERLTSSPRSALWQVPDSRVPPQLRHVPSYHLRKVQKANMGRMRSPYRLGTSLNPVYPFVRAARRSYGSSCCCTTGHDTHCLSGPVHHSRSLCVHLNLHIMVSVLAASPDAGPVWCPAGAAVCL